MAVQPANNFLNGFDLPNAAAAVYTVPAAVDREQITHARLVNHTAGAITVTLWALKNGETRADNYKVIDAVSIAANASRDVTELVGQVLDAGGTIDGLASAATSVSLTLNGTKFTT